MDSSSRYIPGSALPQPGLETFRNSFWKQPVDSPLGWETSGF